MVLRENLTSPGWVLSGRAALEKTLTSATLRALRVFLVDVEKLAVEALDTPMPTHTFTLGGVLTKWYELVLEVLPGSTSELQQRLLDNPIPAEVYEAANTVLAASMENHWERRVAVKELQAALALDAGHVTTNVVITAATEPEQSGHTWKTKAERMAHNTATSEYGNFIMTALTDDPILDSKRWVAHHYKKVRPTHLAADGQTVPVGQPFHVGGAALMYPGDPSGPASEIINCNCSMVGVNTDGASAMSPEQEAVSDLKTYKVPIGGFSQVAHGTPESQWQWAKDRAREEGTANRAEYAKEGQLQARIAEFAGKWTGGFRSIGPLRKQMAAGKWNDVLRATKAQKAPHLYRGMQSTSNTDDLAKMLEHLSVGDTIDNRGISSFTQSKTWGERFMATGSKKYPSLLIEVDNARGLPIAAIGNSSYEEEWLLTGQLRITSLEKVGNQTRVHAEHLIDDMPKTGRERTFPGSHKKVEDFAKEEMSVTANGRQLYDKNVNQGAIGHPRRPGPGAVEYDEGFSPKEVEARKIYSSADHFFPLRDAYNAKQPYPMSDGSNTFTSLDQALSNSTSDHDTTLYRALTVPKDWVGFNAQEGKIIDHRLYISTTTRPDLAKAYGKTVGARNQAQVRLKILAPQGTHMVPGMTHINEWVLRPDARMRVRSSTTLPDGTVEITVDLLDGA